MKDSSKRLNQHRVFTKINKNWEILYSKSAILTKFVKEKNIFEIEKILDDINYQFRKMGGADGKKAA